jgi:hypothetical protein
MRETARIADAVDAGELLARAGGLELYKDALYEARRNDLDLNSSEASLLALLRKRLGVSQAEHYLVEHHRELREFWDKPDAFAHEEIALLSAGVVFFHEDKVLIPEELAPIVAQTLGIDMPTDSARRLFNYLSSTELAAALDQAGARVSGTKEVRVERLLFERVQPRVVLRSVGLQTLKDICRETGAPIGGNKDELIDRVVEHFAQRRDQVREAAREEVRVAEPRRLDEPRFRTLFNSLLHQELTDILRRLPHLKQSGTKDGRIRTLWDAHLSEATLLGELRNRDLENVLQRLGLRISGSKQERIERVVQFFSSMPAVEAQAPMQVPLLPITEHHDVPDDIAERQALFVQKASSPQAELQPWLNEILDARGLVRCYATEDPNPTKQLKNKLSQAAAAKGGLLLLLLSDAQCLEKAREALKERWLTNDEWPKSVACVALAQPIGGARVQSIVERIENPWSERIREGLFPSAEVLRVLPKGDASDGSTPLFNCTACGASLSDDARFCSQCGAMRFAAHRSTT